jgi:hypothetical protein
MQLGDEQSFRLLIHERNRKFSGGFDEVFRLEGIEGDPHADPGAERERLRRVLGADGPHRLLGSDPDPGPPSSRARAPCHRRHYNEHRPRRALDLLPPDGSVPIERATATDRVHRLDLLGWLIHEYQAAA